MSEDAATIGMCWMEQYKVFEVDIHPTLKYVLQIFGTIGIVWQNVGICIEMLTMNPLYVDT